MAKFINFYEDIKLNDISLSSNAWIRTIVSQEDPEVITGYGLGNWTSEGTTISVYFYVKNPVKVQLFIKCKVPEGKSQLEISVHEEKFQFKVKGNHYDWHKVGQLKIRQSGYVRLDLKGLHKTGPFFADVSHLMFVHKYEPNPFVCIREVDSSHRYWSRRGPSVHLSYICNTVEDHQEFYYNEVTVPEGFDPIGSYFMAIGFDVGYFGIQVNSDTERRVLFSVWSPQETDNINELLAENKVILSTGCDSVEYNIFGCEGCGGQSILRYDWKPEITYKFLVRGGPDQIRKNHSLYTAWFAPKDDNEWQMLASFSRPKCRQYLSGFYSFVENFDEGTGFLTRKAYFGNQWICNTKGDWFEVTEAKFTGDSTAENKVRLDFDGGVHNKDEEKEDFYLQNCGFFEGKTELLTHFQRKPNKVKPIVNFERLLI